MSDSEGPGFSPAVWSASAAQPQHAGTGGQPWLSETLKPFLLPPHPAATGDLEEPGSGWEPFQPPAEIDGRCSHG